MVRISFKNLVAHKRRLVSTFLAVLLGVAFLSGTLVLTATLNKTFDTIFETGNAGTDAFVRASSRIESQGFAVRGRIDASLLDTVEAVDGVEAAELYISGSGRIVVGDKALGNPGQGPPTFAESWLTNDTLNPYRVVDGRAPESDEEVVIDRGSAKEGDVSVGDRIRLQVSRTLDLTVVGIVTFGDQDSSGGATYAGLTLATAEREVAGDNNSVDGIRVVAASGVSQEELAARIQRVLPDGVEAITGEALTEENQDDIQKAFLSFFNIFLTIFAVIAVVVSVFSIYNTFSIIVSQRTREMALLRAVGASRRQVLGSVLLEALSVGVLASAAGLVAGLFVAQGLKGLLTATGIDLPSQGLVFGASTVVTSLVVGVLVTLFAGLIPAVKATRIPPIAAIRDVAVERTHASRARIIIGVLLTGLGTLNVIAAVIGKGDNAVAQAGFGAIATLVGVVVLGPVAARPMSRLIGAPLPAVKGVTGELARENAMRNPRRTSGTAAALMIGVGVVALFTVFAASIKATIDAQVEGSFAGDLVVDSQTFGFGGITPDLTTRLNELPEVSAASGLRFGLLKVDDSAKQVVVADPATLPEVLDVGVTEGSLADLGEHQLAVAANTAADHGWAVGTKLPVSFVDGTTDTLEVVALYDNDDVVGGYLLGLAAWVPHAIENFDTFIAVKLNDGVSLEEGRAAVEPLVDELAVGSKLQDRKEFREAQAGQIDQALGLIYALLALAIVISLMGIANTLALSINERTHELGLLRAVGMQRTQLRASIRWEAVIIALFGTIGGLGIGVFFSWALVEAASSEGLQYRLPFGGLVVLLVLGAVAGILAALRPAWRAAKLDVMEAIATP